MSKFEFKVGIKDYVIDTSDLDKIENWNVIVDESYTLPRSTFIEEKFKEVFPKMKLNYMQITQLASRNKVMKEFLSNANLGFIAAVKVPKSLTEIVTPGEFSKIEISTRRYNDLLFKETNELNELSNEFKERRDSIIKNFEDLKEKEVSDPIMKILTLTVEDLPISMSLLIENYSPSDETAPNAKRYGRELLLRYQKMLITSIKENKSIKINELLEKFSTK